MMEVYGSMNMLHAGNRSKARLAKFNGGACKHSKTVAKHHKIT